MPPHGLAAVSFTYPPRSGSTTRNDMSAAYGLMVFSVVSPRFRGGRLCPPWFKKSGGAPNPFAGAQGRFYEEPSSGLQPTASGLLRRSVQQSKR